jgi:hypothetical protein
MWDPDGSRRFDDDWQTWAYLHGGPSAQREFEARRRRRRGFDFARGMIPASDFGPGGQWTFGNAGGWSSVAPYEGPGSYSNPSPRGWGPHLGDLGPPVESPGDYAWGHFESRPGRHHGRGPKGYRRSDARILEDVCEALMFDADIDAADVEVRVEDGEVSLEGTVGDRRQKRRAEDVCDAVPGVKDVSNKLRVAAAEAPTSLRRAKTG